MHVLAGSAGALEEAAVARIAGHTDNAASDRAATRVGIDVDGAGNGAADDGSEVEVLGRARE